MALPYNPSDIVIVGAGALFPDAGNAAAFHDQMMAGRTSVQDLTKLPDYTYRQICRHVYNPRRGLADRTYTVMGSPLDRRRLVELAAAHGLPFEENFMQHIMAAEVVQQCVQGILPPAARAETDCVFALSVPSSDAVGLHFHKVTERLIKHGGAALAKLAEPEFDRFKPARNKEKAVQSVVHRISHHFRLGGLTLQVDAACASSLAALYVASLRLRAGLARYAVVGSVDESLGNVVSLVGFSQLGVLTPEQPAPFDKRADGMAMGEGAAAFLVTTLAEAKKENLPILAVVKNIGASSDGRQGGLTEPTVAGQVLCYERTYGKDLPDRMAYVEVHGTGTKVGDRIELDSLARYFFAYPNMPVGSAKWNLGHTMAAAGSAGLLRAIGIIERHTLPPSPYFENFQGSRKISLTIPRKPVALERGSEPLNIGVSSFGFGGSNFHVWLKEYKESQDGPVAALPPATHEVVVCAAAEADIADTADLFRSTSYRLPPKAWPFIDKLQLLGVLLAEKLLRDQGISPAALDRENMHVIAGVGVSPELHIEMVERVLTDYALCCVEAEHPEKRPEVEKVRAAALADFSAMNDQFVLGGLSNLIASRVTKAFNFRGANFIVDADYASGLVALETARTILAVTPGAALAFDTSRRREKSDQSFRGTGMRCTLLASLPYALQYNLPILSKLGPLERSGDLDAAA